MHRIRYVVQTDYMAHNWKLGGKGVIVEIDESLFAHVKHHRGKDLRRRQIWVFGLRERQSGKCYFKIVKKRDSETLLPIIYERCIAGK
jgi:hypothetical protein